MPKKKKYVPKAQQTVLLEKEMENLSAALMWLCRIPQRGKWEFAMHPRRYRGYSSVTFNQKEDADRFQEIWGATSAEADSGATKENYDE